MRLLPSVACSFSKRSEPQPTDFEPARRTLAEGFDKLDHLDKLGTGKLEAGTQEHNNRLNWGTMRLHMKFYITASLERGDWEGGFDGWDVNSVSSSMITLCP